MSLRRLLVPAVVVLGLLAPSSVAHAQPSADELEAQIDEAWRELEPLIEEHNRVRGELEDNKELSAELAEKLAPLELKVNLAMAALGDVATHYYMGSQASAVNALLAGGSPTTFVDQLTVLDMLAREQRERISEVNQTRLDFEEEKTKVDALIAEQEEKEADLANRQDEIESELAELEELLADVRVTDTGGATGGCPAVSSTGPGAVAAEFACSQIGKPYVYGANGPGSYDCSGLTQAAWAEAGVSLTHYTGSQWNEGRAVSRANAIPGDLVFFYDSLSHVGLYVGDGMMVDAPRTGKNVSMRSIDLMPIAGFRRP